VLVPVEVVVICRPALEVMMTVMYSWSDVATRGVVLTMAVEWEEVVGLAVVAAGALPLPPPPPAAVVPAADVEGSLFSLLLLLLLLLLLFPPSVGVVAGASAEVVGAGASAEVGSGLLAAVVDSSGGGLLALVGSGSGVAEVAGGGAADDAGAFEVAGGAADDESGAAADVAFDTPVPSASCRLPWWRYWLMPSMWMSSSVKAEEAAASATMAPENQALGNMLDGLEIETKDGGLLKGSTGLVYDGGDARNYRGYT
jgi:hypothetical protein